ncbi:NAD(P)-dependent oxidoreductase [Candidatus Aalborgicola defluviihabitans]|uniref:NAD(P)-dependent oxidoreductase n=1 Tax=Candidatus Aalborgicola defluviihabitans TaxID=3386187 RepID=UPI001DE8E8FD|nr:NAD(P)-dependent oxidoreductase [Burkholderiales bacterium]MBK7313917.1 NAD(P)-dependent oxidoreductase [Burkholderiales bacterium]MBL0245066.1 NAD(P)-dependent oxidoreductase [Rhodoferax sp.]
MKIAVLGIGLMGYPMARRLCEAGHQVHVWSRTLHKAQRLAGDGAVVHARADDAVREADLVITMLGDGSVVDQVLFDLGAANAMKAGSLLVDMSSIKPVEAKDHAARLGERNIGYLDAPVSGGTIGAEAGTLAIMVGGKASNYDDALPVFNTFGHSTHVGPVGAGQLAKLANQMIVGATIGVVAEALLLCERGGANMAKVREAITGGFADSRILQVHGKRMVERDFVPRGRMSVQLKDLRNALATANEIGFSAPITALFEQLYAQGIEHGLEDLDQSALFVELASRNGMT